MDRKNLQHNTGTSSKHMARYFVPRLQGTREVNARLTHHMWLIVQVQYTYPVPPDMFWPSVESRYHLQILQAMR